MSVISSLCSIYTALYFVSTEDGLDLKMKITLVVAACITIVLVMYFSLLYFCRQCTKTARYADVSSHFKTSHSFKYRPSALVMVLNNQNDITNYWDSEVNLENDCASVPESVQVSIPKIEA
jgi:hypothetical protein